MKVDGIVFAHSFTQIDNKILYCSRLSKYLKLISVLLNLRNMKARRKSRKVVNPNELTVSKRELRSVLECCSEDNIDKQLRGLRDSGIVSKFSKQGSIEGIYFITLSENLEDNPHVLLDEADKQIIKSCHVAVNKKDYIGNLQKFVKSAAQSVEADLLPRGQGMTFFLF